MKMKPLPLMKRLIEMMNLNKMNIMENMSNAFGTETMHFLSEIGMQMIHGPCIEGPFA